MKTLIFALATASALSFAGVCLSAETTGTKEEPATATVTTQEAAPAAAPEQGPPGERKAYTARIEKEVKELGEKIDELRKELNKAGEKATTEMRHAVDELVAKREALKKRVPKLKKASERAWNDVKAGTEAALEDLKRSLEKARSHFQ